LICDSLTRGGLGPLFFVYIGLQVDLRSVTEAPVLLLLVIAVAFFGKVLGAGLPARLAGLSTRDALCVGVGLSARGAVELVILSIAFEKGVFSDGGAGLQLFSALILMGVVTTMMAPMLLRRLLRAEDSQT
jgi:Kef-type K+ transport system membrane component KefB